LVTEGDEEIAKVLDFGIAKVENPLDITTGGGTRTGAMLGTPYYMSPEQARGKKAVDYRTDLWALAIIAYDCLVGKRAFDSDALGDLVIQICTQPAPVPSQHASVPKGFDEWFQRGANKDPDQRFQSVRQMADGLEQALGGALSPTPITGSEATVYSDSSPLANPRLKLSTNGAAVVTAAPRSARGSPLLWAAIAALVLLGGIALALLGGGTAASEADESASTEDKQNTDVAAAGAPPPVATAASAVTASAAPMANAPAGSVAPVPSAEPSTQPKAQPIAQPTAESVGVKKISTVRKQPVKPAQNAATAAPVKPGEMTKPSAADLFSDRQ
jgi:serine/threonine-protein kinase